MQTGQIRNRRLLATCWTWSGDSAPARGDERSPVPPAERVAAVAAAGWDGIGIVHADLVEITQTMGLAAFKSMLDDAGIHRVELEFITNWWTTGPQRKQSDAVRRDLFEAGAILGSNTIKVAAELASFGAEAGSVPIAEFAAAFHALAEDAAQHDMRVAVEPMPMSNLSTLELGSELVRSVNHPAGGLVVDSWHVKRGGTDYADLVSILDIDKVFVVELADGASLPRGDLWNDATNHRLSPGEGELDLGRFVAEMHRAGWRGVWGVEVISERQRRMDVAQAVLETHRATVRVLRAAEAFL